VKRRTQRKASARTEAAPQRMILATENFDQAEGRTSARTSCVSLPCCWMIRYRIRPFWIPLDFGLRERCRGQRFFKKPCTGIGCATRGPRFSSRVSGWRAGRPAMCKASRLAWRSSRRLHWKARARQGSVTSRRRSSAACACMRAGNFPRKKSSRRRSGIVSFRQGG